jgi:PPK2 family polyphosphate:nucleotide phosphotransferase
VPEPTPSPYLVPFDGSFRVSDAPTVPPEDAPGKKACRKELDKARDELAELQRMLYAEDEHAVLLVFQAMDAAGKDGTIRAVMRGVNPAGCQVSSFKQPSAEELDHDFLWRTSLRLPERGRIGIFNRSYYEETLVVRVHPEYLKGQRLPGGIDLDTIWDERFASIREHEQHMARSGTVILKFWLNVSREEQRQRFLSRLDEPEKNWKFSAGDVKERGHWDAYMHAYEEALKATSRPWAPWYAIPADSKPYMRATVADIVVRTLRGLGLAYPTVDDKVRATFDAMRTALEDEA